ncbi:MAG TPA: helix-turn-helix transcriptional regulator [Vicinamibacterales bacterium]|nr:helix-turn-helix transcriptional regulator [Vicinamibacterales bacterium]
MRTGSAGWATAVEQTARTQTRHNPARFVTRSPWEWPPEGPAALDEQTIAGADPVAKASSPLGEFEQIVLLAILRLGDQAYGPRIRNEIAACTDRSLAPGAVYTTLDRLEEKGLLTSFYGDPTPQRAGRPTRYFTVTAQGVRDVARAQRAFQRLMKGLVLPGASRA